MSYDDPFAPKNGGRNAFGKGKDIGYTVTGVIIEDPQMAQQRDLDNNNAPEFWDDGSPKMQAVVRIQTTLDEGPDEHGVPDDGVRTIWAKGGKMVGAQGGRTLQEAIRRAGMTAKARVAKGGELTVRYVEDGPKNGKPNGPKLYKAIYKAPVAVAAPDPFADELG